VQRVHELPAAAAPLSSPNSVSQAVTSKKPVPDETGLGITITPL